MSAGRSKRNRRHFLLSGFESGKKIELSLKIQSLGGEYNEAVEVFVPEATHVVCSKPSRSEKLLCALATGKWLVTRSYVDESYRAGRWLDESQYECTKQWHHPETLDSEFPAAARWRLHYNKTGTGAFFGWKAAVLMENHQRKEVYKRLITFGGGTIVNLTLPIRRSARVAKQVTHVFIELPQAGNVSGLMEEGVLCLKPKYLGEYLLAEPAPNPRDYLVGGPEEDTNHTEGKSNQSTGNKAPLTKANSSAALTEANGKITATKKTAIEKPTRIRRSKSDIFERTLSTDLVVAHVTGATNGDEGASGNTGREDKKSQKNVGSSRKIKKAAKACKDDNSQSGREEPVEKSKETRRDAHVSEAAEKTTKQLDTAKISPGKLNIVHPGPVETVAKVVLCDVTHGAKRKRSCTGIGDLGDRKKLKCTTNVDSPEKFSVIGPSVSGCHGKDGKTRTLEKADSFKENRTVSNSIAVDNHQKKPGWGIELNSHGNQVRVGKPAVVKEKVLSLSQPEKRKRPSGGKKKTLSSSQQEVSTRSSVKAKKFSLSQDSNSNLKQKSLFEFAITKTTVKEAVCTTPSDDEECNIIAEITRTTNATPPRCQTRNKVTPRKVTPLSSKSTAPRKMLTPRKIATPREAKTPRKSASPAKPSLCKTVTSGTNVTALKTTVTELSPRKTRATPKTTPRKGISPQSDSPGKAGMSGKAAFGKQTTGVNALTLGKTVTPSKTTTPHKMAPSKVLTPLRQSRLCVTPSGSLECTPVKDVTPEKIGKQAEKEKKSPIKRRNTPRNTPRKETPTNTPRKTTPKSTPLKETVRNTPLMKMLGKALHKESPRNTPQNEIPGKKTPSKTPCKETPRKTPRKSTPGETSQMETPQENVRREMDGISRTKVNGGKLRQKTPADNNLQKTAALKTPVKDVVVVVPRLEITGKTPAKSTVQSSLPAAVDTRTDCPFLAGKSSQTSETPGGGAATRLSLVPVLSTPRLRGPVSAQKSSLSRLGVTGLQAGPLDCSTPLPGQRSATATAVGTTETLWTPLTSCQDSVYYTCVETPGSLKRTLFSQPSAVKKRKLSVSVADAVRVAARVKKLETKDQLPWKPSVMVASKPTNIPQPQVNDAAYEMSHHMIWFFEASVEVRNWLHALHCAQGCVTRRRYPQARLLHAVMFKILLPSTDALVSNEAFRVLQHMFFLHPPTTAYMRAIFLQALKPEASNDSLQAHWKTISNVISCVFSVEEESEEVRDADAVAESRFAALLLLRFIGSVLFADHVDNLSPKVRSGPLTEARKRTRQTILCEILWPSGVNIGTTNAAVRDILSAFVDAIQLPEEGDSHKMEIVEELSGLVAMVADLCCGNSTKTTRLFSIDALPSTASVFALHLSHRVKEELDDNTGHLKILLATLKPDWLKVKVLQNLLDFYDTALLPTCAILEVAPPLDLARITGYYLYMLPPVTQPAENVPASPHKKSGTSRRTQNGKWDHSQSQTSQESVTPLVNSKIKIANVNKTNAVGETQLHVACVKNNVNKIKQLLRTPGINVNAQDHCGWTALHEACNHGLYDAVYELLQYRPPRTIKSYFSTTDNKKSCVGVDLLLKGGDFGIIPLHDAVQNNRTEIVRLLLQFGGCRQLEVRSDTGLTALDVAQTDEMRAVLTSTAQHDNMTPLPACRAKPDSQDSLFSSQGSVSGAVTSSLPTEAQYSEVLGSGPDTRTVSSSECYKFVLLLLHLLRSYIQVHDLTTIESVIYGDITDVQQFLNASQESVNTTPVRSGEDVVQQSGSSVLKPAAGTNQLSIGNKAKTEPQDMDSQNSSQNANNSQEPWIRRSRRVRKVPNKLAAETPKSKAVAKDDTVEQKENINDVTKNANVTTATKENIVKRMKRDLVVLRKLDAHVTQLRHHVTRIGEDGATEQCEFLLRCIGLLSINEKVRK